MNLFLSVRRKWCKEQIAHAHRRRDWKAEREWWAELQEIEKKIEEAKGQDRQQAV